MAGSKPLILLRQWINQVRAHYRAAEVETLQVSRLEFRGLVLIPERYKEEIADGLMVSAIIVPRPEESDRLEALMAESADSAEPLYFDVMRVGLCDSPIRMRFGRCLYEEVKEGQRRHLLRLVAEEGDTDLGPGLSMLHQPEFNRTIELAIANRKAVGVLVEELRDAGVLNSAAVQRIMAALVSDGDVTNRMLDRVKGGFDNYF
jgi:hypothetical protein